MADQWRTMPRATCLSTVGVLLLIGSFNVSSAISINAHIPAGFDMAMTQLDTNDVQAVGAAVCPAHDYDTQFDGTCEDKDGLPPPFYTKQILDTDAESCKTVCSCHSGCQALYEAPLPGPYFFCIIYGPVQDLDSDLKDEGFGLTNTPGGFPITKGSGGAGTCFIKGSEVVSSAGDPHLVNLRGEHFDIYQPGSFVLLQLPARAELESTLLLVEANARAMGDPCSVYFQVVTISGNWTKQTEPILFLADPHGKPSGTIRSVPWMHFGPVDVKVIHWRRSGVDFLDVYVKNVARTGHTVGGLLGSDGHKDLEPRPQQCSHRRVARDASSVAAARS